MKNVIIDTAINLSGFARYDVRNGDERTLTVAELISQLSACDPDALVFVKDGCIDGAVAGVLCDE